MGFRLQHVCGTRESFVMVKIMIKRLVLSGLLVALTGCSPTVQNIDATPPKKGCVGQIEQTTQNLTPVANKQLLEKAIGAELEGKLCDGKVLKVKAPVKVYRVWEKEKPLFCLWTMVVI